MRTALQVHAEHAFGNTRLVIKDLHSVRPDFDLTVIPKVKKGKMCRKQKMHPSVSNICNSL